MSPIEVILFTINASLTIGVLVSLLSASNRMLFWSPLCFFAGAWCYYSVIGPLVMLGTGELVDRSLDMRPFLTSALGSGIVFFVCVLIGYNLGRGAGIHAVVRLRNEQVWSGAKLGTDLFKAGTAFMVIGSMLFAVVAGKSFFYMLNPLGMTEERLAAGAYGGAFGNYFAYGIQFFIPGCIALLLACSRHSRAWPVLLMALVVALGIYLSQAFRYRLVLLFGGMMVAWYLDRWKRPSLLLLTGLSFAAILVMGLIGMTRDYGLGIKLERMQDVHGFTGLLLGGVGDAGIFFTSGALIDAVPGQLSYAGIAPIKGALLMPIPNMLLASKNTSGYLDDAIGAIYGRESQTGAAYMFYAEWYYAFGWVGLIGASLLFGLLLGRLWRWFLGNCDDIYAIVLYACLMPFSYVVLSRGYFAQVVMLLIMGSGPAALLYWWKRRQMRRNLRIGRIGSVLGSVRPAFPIHVRSRIRAIT